MSKGETMLNALAALYIQCPESIAQDVAEKVGAYIEDLDKQIQALTKENDGLKETIRTVRDYVELVDVPDLGYILNICNPKV